MLRIASIAAVAGVSGVALLASPALAVFVDFNNAGDLSANFTIPAGTTTAQTFTEAADGGVGDSRAVRPKDTDGTAIYKNGTFAIGVGETFVSSMLIHKVNFTANTSRMLQLGVADDDAGGVLFTNNNTDFISARVDTSSTNDLFQLAVQHRSGGSLSTLAQGPAFALTGGRLYLFTVEIARTGADTFEVSGSLVDYGTDGQTPGSTIASFSSVAVTNASVAGAAELYTGFRSGYNAGAHRLDNYSAEVVPEPATMALALLGGGLLVRRRR